jgi:hypothetical protein
MSKQALNSATVQSGMKDILLNHAGLWESLRERAAREGPVCYTLITERQQYPNCPVIPRITRSGPASVVDGVSAFGSALQS